MKSSRAQLSLIDLVPDVSTPLAVEFHEAFAVSKLPDVPPGKEPTAQFVENVRRFGILYPLVVGRTGEKLEVKDGLRRLATARQLGISTLKVLLVDARAAQGNVIGLAMNEQRSENPIAELRMILELVNEGADLDTIAAATGMTLTRLRRRMRLTKLHREWREIADRGGIKATVAERLAKMSVPDQKRALRLFRKHGALKHTDLADMRKAASRRIVDSLPNEMFAPEATAPTWEQTAHGILAGALAKIPDGHIARGHIEAAMGSISGMRQHATA